MEEVFLVKEDKKSEVENALRQDDLVSRQSITVKLAANMGLEKDGYFIVINGSEEAIKKAGELIKDNGEKYKDKEKVIQKLEEEEESAAQGLGTILGD